MLKTNIEDIAKRLSIPPSELVLAMQEAALKECIDGPTYMRLNWAGVMIPLAGVGYYLISEQRAEVPEVTEDLGTPPPEESPEPPPPQEDAKATFLNRILASINTR